MGRRTKAGEQEPPGGPGAQDLGPRPHGAHGVMPMDHVGPCPWVHVPMLMYVYVQVHTTSTSTYTSTSTSTYTSISTSTSTSTTITTTITTFSLITK